MITHASNAGTNYQMVFIIKNASGSDSGNAIYINNLTNNDFGDLRFTASDGSTVLAAWNSSTNMGINVTCWVKITDNLSSDDVTIYLYYCNTGASTQWSFYSVFPFGDPWDSASLNTTTWPTVTGTPTYTISTTTHSLKITNCGGTWYGGMGFRGSSVTFPTYYRVDDPYLSNTGNSGFNMSIVTSVAGLGGITFMIKNTTTWSGSYYGAVGIILMDYWTGFAHYDYSIYVDQVSKYDTGELSQSSFTTLERVTKIQNSTTPTYNYTVQDTTALRANASTTFGTSLIEIGINKHGSYAFITNVQIGAFAVRSYVSPEPADSTWGAQEGAVPICDETKTAVNSTDSVSVARFSTFWYILVGSLSGYIFSYNQSGSYVNDTWVAFGSSNESWANATHTISLTVGYVISSLVYANNSENGWATSALNSFTVTATFTYYFDTGGSLEVNGTSKNNGTSIVYNSQSTIHLSALPSYGYTLLDFSSSYSSSTDNPWDFTLVNVTSIWAHFGQVSSYILASFTWSPSNPAIAEWVTFDASASGSSGAIANYTWQFAAGDSWSSGVSSTAQHYYSGNATFLVSLIVGGDVGNSSTLTLAIVVGWGANHTCVAAFTYSISRFEFSPSNPGNTTVIMFNGSQSYSTEDITDFSWDFGDGNVTSSGAQDWIEHGYGTDGSYAVTLTVSSTATNTSAMCFQELTVEAGGGGSVSRAGYAAYWLAGAIVVLLILIPTIVIVLRRRH